VPIFKRREKRERQYRFPEWPRWRPVRWLRRVSQTGLAFPLFRVFYSVEISGRRHFRDLEEPCLIVSNHNMHMDQAMLLRAMPHSFRQRVAIAAAASDIYGNPVRGFFASLLGNAFPFSKQGSGIRESLEYMGLMLERHWNILLFPEGKLTVMGPTQKFKSGAARVAIESGRPVLPMRVDVTRPGILEGRWFPTPRAKVRVCIGPAIRFEPGTSSLEATLRLERAVLEA